MAIRYRSAQPADLEHLCTLLNHEFIFDKGRKISFSQRFSSTFCDANAANIFLAEEDGEIVSVFVSKLFDWRIADKTWQGAMIGAVYTDPQRRGEGISSNLLKWGTQTLADAGVQFAVLWTTQAAFYARLGWRAADIGKFGSATVEHVTDRSSSVVKNIVAMASLALSGDRGGIATIDAIRHQYQSAYTMRQPQDYRQLPLPVENVEILLWMKEGKAEAYALRGSTGDIGILYEMVGDEEGFANLWETIRRRCRTIMVNDCAGTFSYRWLTRNTDIEWEDKQLAMWLPLSAELDIATMSQWYIPYFDRI